VISILKGLIMQKIAETTNSKKIREDAKKGIHQMNGSWRNATKTLIFISLKTRINSGLKRKCVNYYTLFR
jgi:ribosome biogenesis protein Tsr3